MSGALIVFSTCPNRDEARKIASAIVEERLAACVQLLGPIESVYRWQGSVEQSEEILLLFKTTESQFPALEKRVTELHSYDTPEILAVPAVSAAEKYLVWLREMVQTPI